MPVLRGLGLPWIAPVMWEGHYPLKPRVAIAGIESAASNLPRGRDERLLITGIRMLSGRLISYRLQISHNKSVASRGQIMRVRASALFMHPYTTLVTLYSGSYMGLRLSVDRGCA
jgi:hypothetical protein